MAHFVDTERLPDVSEVLSVEQFEEIDFAAEYVYHVYRV